MVHVFNIIAVTCNLIEAVTCNLIEAVTCNLIEAVTCNLIEAVSLSVHGKTATGLTLYGIVGYT